MNRFQTDTEKLPVWSEVRRQLLRVSGAIFLFSIVYNLLMLAIPIYSLQIFDRITISQSPETLIMLLMAASICVTGAVVFDSLRRHLSRKIAENTFQSLLPYGLEVRGRTAMSSHHDSANAFRWTTFKKLCDGLKSPIITTLSDALISPLVLLILFFLAWQFAAAMITISAMMLLICCWQARVFALSQQRDSHTSNDQYQEFQNQAAQQSSGAKLNWFDSEYRSAWSNNRHQELTQTTAASLAAHEHPEQQSLSQSLNTAMSALRHAGQVVVPTIGAYLLIKQEITTGTLLAAIMLSMRSLICWEQVFHHCRQLMEVCSGLKSLKNSLDEESGCHPRQTPVIPLSGNMMIEHGSAGNQSALPLATGSITAIIGPTGAGKSQLLNALMGIPSDSASDIKVTFDGIDVNNLNRSCFSDSVSVVTTTLARPDCSIRDFVTAHHEIDTEKLQRAFHLSGLEKRIESLPAGYDTVINSHPLTRAAGVFNLIQLARSIYCEPKFLFIDDIDSQLDKAGLQHFELLLQQLKSQSTTCVLTTQRKSLLHRCDQVLLINKNKLYQFCERDLSGPATPSDMSRRLA